MMSETRRRPIGRYLSDKLKRARVAAGGWAEVAKLIPAGRSNAKNGTANKSWLNKLAMNPDSKINEPTRTRLKAMLKQVLKEPRRDHVERFLEDQADAPIPHRSALVTINVNGNQVSGSAEDLARLLTKR